MERPEDNILQQLLDSLELLKKFSCPHCGLEIIGWEDPEPNELEEVAGILRKGAPVSLTYTHTECLINPKPFIVRLFLQNEKLVIQFPVPIPIVFSPAPSAPRSLTTPEPPSQPVPVSMLVSPYPGPVPPTPSPRESRGRVVPVPPPRAKVDAAELKKRQIIEQKRRNTRLALLAFVGSFSAAAGGTFVWWVKKADMEIQTVECRIERTAINELIYTPHCEGVDSARLEDVRLVFGQTIRAILVVPLSPKNGRKIEYSCEIQYHAGGSDIKKPYRVRRR